MTQIDCTMIADVVFNKIFLFRYAVLEQKYFKEIEHKHRVEKDFKVRGFTDVDTYFLRVYLYFR